MSKLVLPKLPSEFKFDEIMKKLSAHFQPTVNIRAERYKFNRIVQEKRENIGDFVICLKAAAQTCDFGKFLTADAVSQKNKALDDVLIDRFINGLSNEKIQHKLLDAKEESFEKIVETAVTMEITQRDVRALSPLSQNVVDVNETNLVRHSQWKQNASLKFNPL